jgi:hypothetical protein
VMKLCRSFSFLHCEAYRLRGESWMMSCVGALHIHSWIQLLKPKTSSPISVPCSSPIKSSPPFSHHHYQHHRFKVHHLPRIRTSSTHYPTDPRASPRSNPPLLRTLRIQPHLQLSFVFLSNFSILLYQYLTSNTSLHLKSNTISL